jgi:hypothetical protein
LHVRRLQIEAAACSVQHAPFFPPMSVVCESVSVRVRLTFFTKIINPRRGGAAWMSFLGLSFKSHWRMPIPEQNRGSSLNVYHSCFDFFSMHLTAGTCQNSRLLAMWCLKRKTGPIRKVKVCGCVYYLMIITGGMVHSSEKNNTWQKC